MPPFQSRSTGAFTAARISSSGVMLGDVPVDVERRRDLGSDLDRLEGPREHAAARRDELGVVVGPRRPGQAEQPPPLGERGGGIRVRVEEHMAVVEGHDQPDVLAEEHAVAEDVAAHVADARDGEVLGLGVDAELAEVPLDRLPRPAGRDAHGLVVVADRAAGGERVPEPEAVLGRDRVREVGEGRRALVRGDDEVGVVAVVTHHVARRHDHAVDEVVGDVEQRHDELAVGGLALGEPGVAVERRVGEPLRVEAALGADRHDHRVLDLLRLDQAEHLGAEVLLPVAPAQAAAGHGAEPQVHALDAGRVHPDLELRAWAAGGPGSTAGRA